MIIKTFPETVYVYRDNNVKEQWLLVEEELESCIAENRYTEVGIYKLEKVVNATLKITREVTVK